MPVFFPAAVYAHSDAKKKLQDAAGVLNGHSYLKSILLQAPHQIVSNKAQPYTNHTILSGWNLTLRLLSDGPSKYKDIENFLAH